MEVCVDNLESAINAENGGASRIELCSSLEEGGLTPSVGFIKMVKTRLKIPIFVMIRCRGGGFVYSPDELQIMLEDIRQLKANGADGFVFGVLDEQRNVDVSACELLLRECKPLPVTFHRAFDEVRSPLEDFQKICDLGFSRLLTSGCAASAEEGLPLIKELVALQKIIVMPGAGIGPKNVEKILRETHAVEFHGSAKVKVERNGHLVGVTDASSVWEMVDVYRKVTS